MPNALIRQIYRILCRLNFIDVSRLLYWEDTPVQWPAPPAGYSVRVLGDEEIAQWRGREGAPVTLLDTSGLPRRDRVCVATLYDARLVSYLWVGRGYIEAHNNCGQSAHLGTSVDLPDAAGFVYNAWTHPEHRGLRLIGVMLGHVSEHRLLGTTALLTTVDWTNESSRRAFARIGMRSMGLVWRLGWGRCQLTLLPRISHIIDLQLATAPRGCSATTTSPL